MARIPHLPGRQVGPDHRGRPRHRRRAGPQGGRPGAPGWRWSGWSRSGWPRVADELGPEHLWVEADVTDAEALKAAVQRTVDTFGGLDIAVANAGIAPLTTVATGVGALAGAHHRGQPDRVDAHRARGAARGREAARATSC